MGLLNDLLGGFDKTIVAAIDGLEAAANNVAETMEQVAEKPEELLQKAETGMQQIGETAEKSAASVSSVVSKIQG